MSEKKTIETINKSLKKALSFEDEAEMLEFQELVINADFIEEVKELMLKHNIGSQTELAAKLKVSEPYISKLFSGDKYINVPFLAKIQSLFNMRFKIVDSDKLRPVIYAPITIQYNTKKNDCEDSPKNDLSIIGNIVTQRKYFK